MRATNHKDGLGTVTFDWRAEKDNSYKFAGYEVTVHNERAHTYHQYEFSPTEYNDAANCYLKACKEILYDEATTNNRNIY